MKKLLLIFAAVVLITGTANAMYLIGEPAGGWSPNKGIEMTKTDDGWQWRGAISQDQYFAFATELEKSGNWDVFNANYRLSPSDDGLIASEGDYKLRRGSSKAFRGPGMVCTLTVYKSGGEYFLKVKYERDIVYQNITYTVLDEEAKTVETKQGFSINSPGNDVSGVLTIPKTVYDGETAYTVVAIGVDGFANCRITEINLPETVTTIGNYAFSDCNEIPDFIVPPTIKTLGRGAFQRCDMKLAYSSETEVVGDNTNAVAIPYNAESAVVENGIITQGDTLLFVSHSVESYEIPSNIKNIGRYSFYKSNLNSLNIPSTIEEIGLSAFKGCTIETLNVDMELIPDYCFEGTKIASLTFGDSVKNIGSSAFRNCSALTSLIIPESITSIGNEAFKDCRRLTDVSILEGNEIEFGYSVFYGTNIKNLYIGRNLNTQIFDKSKIESLTIGNSVTEIGNSAWSDASNLTTLTLGTGITSIGNQAFKDCSSLTELNIPDAVQTIGNAAFSGCNKLTEMSIPESVTTIGESAFTGCSSLAEVTVGNSVTSIGDETFKNCTLLKTVNLPNSLATIGYSAFEECTSLTEIVIPNSVTSIGGSAFYDCSGLTEVIIPNSVTVIGYSAFYDCKSLAEVTFGNSVTTICENAFSYCRGLTEVVLPSSLSSIGKSAFSGCSALTEVTFGNSVTTIGDNAFSYCRGLTEVVLPSSLSSIGKSAFSDCSGLIKSAYPNKLSNPFANGISIAYTPDGAIIEDGIIYGPGKLSILYATYKLSGDYEIPSSVTSIGDKAFFGCSGLTEVIIPNKVTTIGESAFSDCSGLIKSAYPNTVSNPFTNGISVAYNPDDAVIEDHWIYSPDKTNIYFAPYTLKGEYSIPESVATIGKGAFRGCRGLTEIAIPNSVTSIGGSAFYDCI